MKKVLKNFRFKRNLTFTIITTTLLFTFGLMLTGCYNYSEITELAIVLGAAIDKNEDGTFTLTMEVVSFEESNESTSISDNSSANSKIVESTGDTLYEAIIHSTNIIGKKTFWDHAKAIIISKNISKEDFDRVIDCLMRNNETNVNTKVFVAETEKASDILRASSPFHSFLSFDFYSTLEIDAKVSESYNIDLYKIVDRYGYDGISLPIPSLNIINDEDEAISIVSGMGIFNKEQFVHFVSDDDIIYYLFTINDVESGKIELIAGDNQSISFKILKSNTNVSINEYEKDIKNIEVTYDIDVDFEIKEYAENEKYFKNGKIVDLEKMVSLYLENEISNFILDIQSDYQTDIFDIARKFKNKYPDEWDKVKNNWIEKFKNVKFNVNVNANIINSGAINSVIKS